MGSDKKKVKKLFNEYLDAISSDEYSVEYLKEDGVDTDALIARGLKKIRLMEMELASQQTEIQYASLKSDLLARAIEKVNELLSSGTFKIEKFLREENLQVSYRNFDNMNETEIREFLKEHYLLKLGNENKKEKK
jgi:hypothetical protein